MNTKLRRFDFNRVLIWMVLGIIAFHPAAVESQEAAENPKLDRIAKWEADLQMLAEELPARHKNLFFQLPEDQFHSKILTLKEGLPEMSDDEIAVEMMKIIAAVGDSHTSLHAPAKLIFPIKFYWFKEGIIPIQTTEEYKDILHHKLLNVEEAGISEIIGKLTAVIGHENQAQIEHRLPNTLFYPEILAGLHIIPQKDRARFTFEDEQGNPYTVIIRSISIKENPPPVSLLSDREPPLYQKKRQENYWYEYLEKDKLLYFQYNRCVNNRKRPIMKFTEELLGVLENQDIEKLVIDLRNNGGGNSLLLMKFINGLKNNTKLNQKGKLFVIIGRRTFSSAILNAAALRNLTQALFVGEPTGGKPNHYGEVKAFKLKHSGFTVSYSTKYFSHSKEDTPSLMPDILVKLSIRDYLNGFDPVLDNIMRQ